MKKFSIFNFQFSTKQKTLFFVFLSLVIFSSAHFALAWSWGQPLLPQCSVSSYGSNGTVVIQNPCTTCDLFVLIKNLIDFVTLGVVPVVGTLLFIVGGFFILLGGANPSLVSRGKSIMWSTTIGIVIVLAAWLITNTLMLSLTSSVQFNGVTRNPSDWFLLDCSLFENPGGPIGGGGYNYSQASYGGGYSYGQASYGGGPYCDVSGECVGGVNAGNFCQSNNDCTGAATPFCDTNNQECVGGPNAGNFCQNDSDCSATIFCDTNNQECVGGPNAGNFCLSNSDCTSTNSGPQCVNGECFGGPNAGNFCQNDSDCNGSSTAFCDTVNQECIGGPNSGNFCQNDNDC